MEFHLNCFYSGIRSILESNHSYLVVKVLLMLLHHQTLHMIYKYFHIFSSEFRRILNQYILNKIFHQLFLHWCQNVRRTFHLLLYFKIMNNSQALNENNPESIETL